MQERTLVKPQDFNLDENQVAMFTSKLPSILEDREKLKVQYEEIIRMDIEDKKTSKQAREVRLALRKNRTAGIETWHKESKEFFLRGGQYLDAIRRQEVAINEAMEDDLSRIEKHQELKEQARREELRKERFQELEPYWNFVPGGLSLGDLEDEEYTKVLNGARLQFEDQIRKEQQKAEEERIAREREELHKSRWQGVLHLYQYWPNSVLDFSEYTQEEYESFLSKASENKEQYLKEQEELRKKAEEADRIRKETEARLEAERIAAQEELRKRKEAEDKERARIQAENERKLAEERAKQEKLRQELEREKERVRLQEEAERKQAEEKARQLTEEKKRQEELAKAPIKAQLKDWLSNFSSPETPISHAVQENILAKFNGFKTWALGEIEKL